MFSIISSLYVGVHEPPILFCLKTTIEKKNSLKLFLTQVIFSWQNAMYCVRCNYILLFPKQTVAEFLPSGVTSVGLSYRLIFLRDNIFI